MKEKGEYDGGFEVYKDCVDIYGGCGGGLYEICEFYMVVGEEEKGEEGLKKGVDCEE